MFCSFQIESDLILRSVNSRYIKKFAPNIDDNNNFYFTGNTSKNTVGVDVTVKFIETHAFTLIEILRSHTSSYFDTLALVPSGGPQDPCSLNNNNDANDGLNKNPSACQGDTFYLWDEPDTQGRDYAWAGREWVNYANRFRSEISSMRRRGVKFTSPLLRADNTESNLRSFFLACGAACSDRSSPAYIDAIGVNVFCGPWNMAPGVAPVEGCRAGARYMVGIFQNIPQVRAGLPVYVTNWSRLQVSTAADQLAAMYAVDAFYSPNSPVERVYWFGAIDYGGGSTNNFLTDLVTSGADAGKSLGQVWASVCGGGPAPPSPSPCTEEGGDPYNTPGGEFVACCEPLTACLRDWNGDGNWFYICRSRC